MNSKPYWITALGWFALGAAASGAIAVAAARRPALVAEPVALTLSGAGASFPYPLYRRWFAAYGDSTGRRINYFSVGSAGGIIALSQGDVDFGASDRPLRATERTSMRCGDPIAVPTAVGAVALAYHLPSLNSPLQLDAETIAGMFDGTITRWDHSRIRAVNPQVELPALPLVVVHRSDGSGTSRAFLSFLSRHAQTWRMSANDDAGAWPTGRGATGNEGVAAEVQVTPGAIGYMEVSYARQMRLPVAAVQNAAGAFVLPTSQAVAAAANAAFRGQRVDSVTSLLGVSDAAAYPIASLTWLLLPPQARDTARLRAVFDLARWALAQPASEIERLGYAPIPRDVAAFHEGRLSQYAITPCLPRPIVPRSGI